MSNNQFQAMVFWTLSVGFMVILTLKDLLDKPLGFTVWLWIASLLVYSYYRWRASNE